jgi:hypothetical protein
MSVLSNSRPFTPAGTTTINVAGGGQTHTSALPTIDGSNTSLIISHTCSFPVYVQIGTIGNMPAGPSVPGSLLIRPGVTELLTSGSQGAATFVAINSAGVGTLTVTRGTAAGLTSFASADDQVRV